MSKLIIHEPPLQVLPSLAKAIGLNEAIALQQIHYWLQNPKAGIVQNGHKWIFNTYEEWKEQFPFWSVSTIRRVFSSLEKQGLLISEQLNQHEHDMTNFYRIDYGLLEQMDVVKLDTSNGSSWTDVNRNTETSSETTKGEGKKPSRRRSRKKPIDPRLDHPALVGYRTMAHLHVPVTWRDRVIDTVGNVPTSVECWMQIVDDWVGNGWNKTNVRGMLDAYRNGGVRNGNGKPSHREENQRLPKGV